MYPKGSNLKHFSLLQGTEEAAAVVILSRLLKDEGGSLRRCCKDLHGNTISTFNSPVEVTCSCFRKKSNSGKKILN